MSVDRDGVHRLTNRIEAHLPSIQPSGITPWMAEPKKSCSVQAILGIQLFMAMLESYENERCLAIEQVTECYSAGRGQAERKMPLFICQRAVCLSDLGARHEIVDCGRQPSAAQ